MKMDEVGLRKIEVLRNNEWVKVRLQEVKKGEKFRMFEEDILGNYWSEWIATKDGFLYDIVRDIGAIEAK